MYTEKRNRLGLTVAMDVMVALDILSEKSGLAPSTQARLVLRQALSQTINSEEGQRRLAKRRAYLTAEEWRDERSAVAADMNAERTGVDNVGRQVPT